MRTSTLTISLVAALAAAQTSLAQQLPEGPSERAPSTEAPAISDDELETFAAIYVDLIDTAAKYQAEMESAQSEQQALAIRQRAQAEGVAKVARRGWTPEKFGQVGDTINNDPALTERAVRLIEAK
ncbi:MAG TPA: DUF4168 domain-containing protein [Gammaproteobacteria bacterium]